MLNLRWRDVESFVLEAQQKIAQQLKLPQGYTTFSFWLEFRPDPA